MGTLITLVFAVFIFVGGMLTGAGATLVVLRYLAGQEEL